MIKNNLVFTPQKRKLLALLLKEKGVRVSKAQDGQAISKRTHSGPIPLAMNQEGLWFLEQMDPGKAHYNIPGAIRLRGHLDVSALEQSLSEIVRRHESLRTTFIMNEDGAPIQRISSIVSLKLPLVDLMHLPLTERQEEAGRVATEAAYLPFDLTQGPLFYFQLLKLDKEEHVLILNIHHIVADGWSMGVFTREFSALYQAFSNGTSSPLPELPIQYADFALWQRQRMQGELLENRLSYWKRQLRGNLPALQMPTDHARPKVQSYRGGHQPIKLSKFLTAALRMLAQREGMTVYMILLAAFKVLLFRYSGQNDIVVGSTFANRNISELEQLIGFFVNTLPLRTDLSGNPGFLELSRRVRDVILGASAHQELPLTKLVQEMQPERVSDRNPFYQVVFDLLTPDHNPAVYGYGLSLGEIETLKFSGLAVSSMNVEYGITRFDLAVFIWDFAEGFNGAFEYSADLFEPATITRMVEDFEILLKHIVSHPHAPLSMLVEHLKQEDRQQRISKEEKYKESIHWKLKQIKRRSIV